MLQGIAQVTGGGGNGFARKSDGTVYGWGNNIDGRVGDGTLVTRDTPVVVVGEEGEGTLEGNDWYVNLDPSIQKTIPPELVPPDGKAVPPVDTLEVPPVPKPVLGSELQPGTTAKIGSAQSARSFSLERDSRAIP